jgi:hypothetical protein
MFDVRQLSESAVVQNENAVLGTECGSYLFWEYHPPETLTFKGSMKS